MERKAEPGGGGASSGQGRSFFNVSNNVEKKGKGSDEGKK